MAASHYLIAVIVVVILRATPIDCDTQDLIVTVCQSTEDRGFCTRVFNQNIKSPSTNMSGLSEIALDQGMKNATNSNKYVKELSYNTADHNLKLYLINCATEGYATALGGLQKGQLDLEQSKFDDMVTVLLSAAKSQSSNCDVEPMGGTPNPIYERNREMRILISMAVATAFELKG